jgi:transcriptional regulator with AAA-type ATPase domain
VEKAVEAMRLGAYDFLEKPIDSAVLLKAVAKALEKQRLSSENRQLRRQLRQGRSVDALVGESPGIEAVKRLIRQVAPTNVTVLIQGESGTGKEIVADAIHDLSERSERPLLKISCAAIPETLLESEIFGHERGAFTGAAAAKPGKFELADGGTLLLDEIAEMTPQLQAKLLRVLQDGQFQRLGGTRNQQADVRLLAATHADLAERITQHEFRHDLYYRINTVQISLPPLRERPEDIPLLAARFLARFSAEMQRKVRAIAPGAMEQLLVHPWPGNVRELDHGGRGDAAAGRGDDRRLRRQQIAGCPDARHRRPHHVPALRGRRQVSRPPPQLRITGSAFSSSLNVSRSREVIQLFGIGPDLPFGGGVGQWRLAGVRFLPPPLRFRVGRHLLHVGLEILAGIFEVSEQVELAFELPFVDGEIPDVALLDHPVHGRPGMGVKLAVVGGFLGSEPGHPRVALGRSLGRTTGERRGEQDCKDDFHIGRLAKEGIQEDKDGQ